MLDGGVRPWPCVAEKIGLRLNTGTISRRMMPKNGIATR